MASVKRDGPLYGFYSAESLRFGNGTVIYLTPDGREVEVNGVYTDPEGSDFHWPDKVCVGEVVKFVRRGVVTEMDAAHDRAMDDWATSRGVDYWDEF